MFSDTAEQILYWSDFYMWLQFFKWSQMTPCSTTSQCYLLYHIGAETRGSMIELLTSASQQETAETMFPWGTSALRGHCFTQISKSKLWSLYIGLQPVSTHKTYTRWQRTHIQPQVKNRCSALWCRSYSHWFPFHSNRVSWQRKINYSHACFARICK